MARKDTLLIDIERLAWRPFEFATAKQMKVQMKDGLPGMRANIGHEAIALLQIELVGQLLSDCKNMCQNRSILRGQIGHRGNMARWNDQKMMGSLGIDILKGHHILVLVHNIAGNLALDDLTKQAILHKNLTTLECGNEDEQPKPGMDVIILTTKIGKVVRSFPINREAEPLLFCTPPDKSGNYERGITDLGCENS
jgi:hypothetical protein